MPAERWCSGRGNRRSLEELLDGKAARNHVLAVDAVDRRFEVAPVVLDAERMGRWIAGSFPALLQQIKDPVRRRRVHGAAHHRHVVDLDGSAGTLAPCTRRGIEVLDERLDARILRQLAWNHGVKLAGK